MKRFLTLAGCCMLLACSEPFELSKDAQGVPAAGNVTTQDIGPAPVPSYAWRTGSLPVLPGPYPSNRLDGNMQTVLVNGNAYWFFGTVIEFIYKLNTSTKRWEKFTGPEDIYNFYYGDYDYLFSYGTKYYFGFRIYPGPVDPYGDEAVIYSHDIVTGESVAMPDFPGTLTTESTFFAIGDKAYVMGGRNGNVVSNQLWELNLNTHVWTNKGGVPGGARAGAVAYVMDDKVYFGLGYSLIYGNGQWVKVYKDDWYSMNPAGGSGLAAVRADFPGPKRGDVDGFVIGKKIFLGWGRTSAGQYLSDFWEYNTANHTWTQRSDCPAEQDGVSNMDAFAIGDTGYFIRGWLGDYRRYSASPIVIGPVGG